MIEVVIIGSGNVAQHLILAFAKSKKIDIVQVFSRQKEAITHLLDSSKITDDWNNLAQADLYIIAVSDGVIAEVSSQIPFTNKLVAHTSGSVAFTEINSKNRRAVFYPLQTFTKDKPVDFSQIPICIESENATDYQLLNTIGKTISDVVIAINSEQRKALHIAAVYVNNFVNYMYQIGNEICIKNNVEFEILKPLIQETAKKIMMLSPKEAQTGPAKRDDKQTIESHLVFLKDENHRKIYKILTQSIQNNGK